MAQTDATTSADLQAEAQDIIARMREAVAAGQPHWFIAVLEAIGHWPLAREQVGDRTYCYLIGGEAFDWLLLAERLCEELQGLVPEDECEELLFLGRLPLELAAEDFRRHLGAAKHRAHLNFLYGVRVEEALQLAVQQEVHKERFATRIWENGHVDDEVCQRIYGATRVDLLQAFRSQPRTARTGVFCHPEPSGVEKHGVEGEGSGASPSVQSFASSPATDSEHAVTAGDQISLGELTEFTYWLFRYRVNYSDPARVASDTRKGLAFLQHMDARGRRA